MRPMSLIVPIGAIALVACTPEPLVFGPRAEGGDEVLTLAPPAPGEGVQYRMLSPVGPAEESYGCQLFVAPPEGLHIHHEEVEFGRGGHHVLLYKTPYKELPTHDEQGKPVNAGEVHDCAGGATSLWKVDGVIGGSETFGGKGILSDLPEGVALTIEPGAVLLMSTHYLNPSTKPVEADARINLYTMPKEHVRTEAGVLYLNHPHIRVPANGEASARMRCPVSKNIAVVSLQSHMHARGTLSKASLWDGVVGRLEEVYSNENWQEPHVEEFGSTPLTIKAGMALDYRCDYENPTARDVTQGLTADDEMCQLIGPYYPRDVNLESCQREDGVPAATWFGRGAADGKATYECIQKASASKDDTSEAIHRCIEESCEEVADEVSDVARCYMSQGFGECSDTCADPTCATCKECLSTACEPEIDASKQATCG